MRSPDIVSGVAAAGLAGILVLLTGCAVVNDLAYGRADASYANEDAFHRDDPELAPWLPAGAEDIRLRSSTRAADTHTLRYTAADAPDDCEEVPRRSGSPFDMGEDFDVYTLDTVLACDGWAVAHEGDTWIAWTPAVEADDQD